MTDTDIKDRIDRPHAKPRRKAARYITVSEPSCQRTRDVGYRKEVAQHTSRTGCQAAARFRLVDLLPHQCRFPFGDPKTDPDFGFCGRRRVQGTSYCPEHLQVCQPDTYTAGRLVLAPTRADEPFSKLRASRGSSSSTPPLPPGRPGRRLPD